MHLVEVNATRHKHVPDPLQVIISEKAISDLATLWLRGRHATVCTVQVRR